MTILHQDGAANRFELSKTLIEGDEFKPGDFGESGQVCVGPDLRRIGLVLREGSPNLFHASGFIDVVDTRVGAERVICLPGFREGDGGFAQRLRVGGQAQKSHLRDPAKANWRRSARAKPAARRNVVLVSLERHAEPNIDIKKLHLLGPECPQCGRWSAQWSLADRKEKSAARLVGGVWSSELLSVRTRSRPRLRAKARGHQSRQRRSELVRIVSCVHYLTAGAGNQVQPKRSD